MIAIDLYCGLGGWTEGLLAEGWNVIGFDNERHEYGDERYPAQLVLQDVLTIHGKQFKDVDLIVASPPCTEFSYMAMPWSRGKQIARALKGEDEFPEGYHGSRTVAELTALFDACFRIQREASEAAGHYIPMIVENVRGAQEWVGAAPWHYGSFYLWGDVPLLMPMGKKFKSSGMNWCDQTVRGQDFTAIAGRQALGRKQPGISGIRDDGKGDKWFQDGAANGSKSNARKMASAMIAKIPLELSWHIANVYKPT